MPHFNKKMISFFLTTKCNLCCRYCYNAKERNEIEEHTLSLNIAKSGIDWYFKNNNSRHIRFYGPGEPTQEFKRLCEITNYAKTHPNRGKDVTVEIQTNGVFTSDVREWISKNVDIMWLSFDGMKEIQNYNRPLNPKFKKIYNDLTSAEIIEDNVKWLNRNKINKDLMIGARVTITDKNIDSQVDMIDYFYSIGIKYIWTNPLFYSVGKIPVSKDAEKKASYSFDMKKYVENYIKAYEYAKKLGVFWGSFLTINFDGESPYHCRCCDPLSAPHLTPDGYISACDMVVLGAESHHMDLFIVGKWDDKSNSFVFDFEKIKALNDRKSTNMQHCQNCSAQLHCGGCCLGETVNEFGKLDGQNLTKCIAIRTLLEKLGTCEPYPYLHP